MTGKESLDESEREERKSWLKDPTLKKLRSRTKQTLLQGRHTDG